MDLPSDDSGGRGERSTDRRDRALPGIRESGGRIQDDNRQSAFPASLTLKPKGVMSLVTPKTLDFEPDDFMLSKTRVESYPQNRAVPEPDQSLWIGRIEELPRLKLAEGRSGSRFFVDGGPLHIRHRIEHG